MFLHHAPLPADPASGELAHPLVTDLDADSPLLRLVNLRDVTFLRAQAWDVPDAGGAPGDKNAWKFAFPVRSLDHPLVVTGERGRSQRFAALAFGAADSDLPLRVAFPLFIHNAVSWLAGHDGTTDTAPAGIRAGETIRLAAGETLWTRPQREYQPVGEGPAVERLAGPGVFQPMRAGFYRRRGADGADSWLAVNTSDRTMSALNTPAGTVPAEPGGPMPAAGAGWETVWVWPPWVYLALTAFTLCTLEWWGFHRRRTE